MPRKKETTLEEEILEERRCKTQCLLRNADYMALCEEAIALRSRRRDANRSLMQGAFSPAEMKRINRWLQTGTTRGATLDSIIAKIEQRRLLPPEQEEVAALLRRTRHTRTSVTALMNWAQKSVARRLQRERHASEDRLEKIHEEAARRYGLAMIWDPRPFKDAPAAQFADLHNVFFDAIVPIVHLALPKFYAEPLSVDAASRRKGAPIGPRDDRLASFCAHGTDLFLMVDVRHSRARLHRDFELLLERLEKLKEARRLAVLPERPSQSPWEQYLHVWDLRASMTNDQVAHALWPGRYKHDRIATQRLANRYFRESKRWIRLEWAHPR
ncbi:MAG: hypothetical protein ACKVU1_04430 [bacterium]